MDINGKNGRRKTKLATNKVARFFDKQGFYIVLFLCLTAIGLTAYFAFQGGESSDITEGQQQGEQVHQIPGGGLEEQLAQTTPKLTIMPAPTPKATMEALAPTPAPSSAQAYTQRTVTLAMPLEGEISKVFSSSALLYSKTLNQWSTHSGIDIAAQEGTDVKAALAGTVESVKSDAMMGFTVVLKHDNDQKTTYANLAETTLVEEGNKVTKGQVIGKVGKTAIAECMEEAHLHFEYSVKGQTVDPAKYLPAIATEETMQQTK